MSPKNCNQYFQRFSKRLVFVKAALGTALTRGSPFSKMTCFRVIFRDSSNTR
jgi:hypothetical protein